MKPKPAPFNPRDKRQYVWDWCNDRYVRLIPPAAIAHGWDTEDPSSIEVHNLTPLQLIAAHGFRLGKEETRNLDELNCVGSATIWYDLFGLSIAFFHHESGIVASIPEWRNVNWQAVDLWWEEMINAVQ